jgi:N-acetylglucosaminyldiphosphoundecaprenol N-acetyl-beta-D-mannosaminyltransferase
MKQTAPSRVEVAGIGFDPITQDQLISDIDDRIRQKKRVASLTVYKPYVEFFVKAWNNPQLKQIINCGDRVVADGVAVQWAASYLSGKRSFWNWLRSWLVDIQNRQWRERVIPERGAGVDATHKLLVHAVEEDWSVGIFGGPRDIEHTKKAMHKLYPKLRLVGVWSGFYDTSEEGQIMSQIQTKYPDILFVAQGFPRQEKLIDKYRSKNIAKVMIGEGGTFDYDSMGGDVRRALSWLRRFGLEWLWRLIIQPKRWRRQTAIPVFLWRIYKIGKEK